MAGFVGRTCAVVAQYVDVDRAVFGHRRHVAIGRWCVIDFGHRHRHRSWSTGGIAVGHCIAEAGYTIKVSVRRKGYRAIAIQNYRTATTIANRSYTEVAIGIVNIDIVAQKLRYGVSNWSIFSRRQCVCHGNWRIIGAGDGDGNGLRVGTAMAVIYRNSVG